PVGFPFFNDLQAKVGIVGFIANFGASFPAPNENDAKILFKVLTSGLGSGHFDPSPLRRLQAPSIGIHDVYLQFPRVPGYAYTHGRFHRTHDVFKAIFGSNRLNLVNRITLGPPQIYDLATASNAYDIAKLLIPQDKRKGNVNLNLRGFHAGASYELYQTSPRIDNIRVPKLPEISRLIAKIRYADKQTSTPPTAVTTSGNLKLIKCWGANDHLIKHDIGSYMHETPFLAKLRKFIRAIALSPQAASFLDTSNKFAGACIQALLMRPPQTYTFPVFAPDQYDILPNPFLDPNRFAEKAENTDRFSELDVLKTLLDQDISRNTALAYLMEYHRFLDSVLPKLQNRDTTGDDLRRQFVHNALTAFTGKQPEADLIQAWTSYLQYSAPWTNTEQKLAGTLAATPQTKLLPGSYIFTCQASSSLNGTPTPVIKITIANGKTPITATTITAADFLSSNSWQTIALPFQLTSSTPVSIAIQSMPSAQIAVRELMILQRPAQSSQKTIRLPKQLGGGTATVKWKLVDMTAETNAINAAINNLVTSTDCPNNAILTTIAKKLQTSAGSPTISANQLTYQLTPEIRITLALEETFDGRRISNIRTNQDKLQATFGSVAFYPLPEYRGMPLILTGDVSDITKLNLSTIASIKTTAGSHAILHSEPGFTGQNTPITTSVPDTSELPAGLPKSIQIWQPIALSDISRWHATLTTTNGTIAQYDAGGLEIIFPSSPAPLRALTILPHSRLARTLKELLRIIAPIRKQLKKDNPAQYLTDIWKTWFQPASQRIVIDQTKLSITPPDPNSHPIIFQPISVQNRNVTAVIRETSDKLSVVTGTATIFTQKDYTGEQIILDRNLETLAGTPFAATPPAAVKLNGPKTITFYANPNFNRPQTIDPGTPFSLPIKKDGNYTIVAHWNQQATDHKIILSVLTWETDDDNKQSTLTREYTITPNNPTISIPGNQHFGSCQISGDTSMVQNLTISGYSGTFTISADTPDLSNLPFQPQSIRITTPLDINLIDQWTITHALDPSLTLSLQHQQRTTSLNIAFKHSRNTITIDPDTNHIIVRNASGYLYPLSGITATFGEKAHAEKQFTAISRYLNRVISKTIIIPDAGKDNKTISALINPHGGITTACFGTHINWAAPDSQYSYLDLRSSRGHQLRFKLAPGQDLTSAILTNEKEQPVVDTYTRRGVPIGVKIQRPGDNGNAGLRAQARLTAGDSRAIRINVLLRGDIRKDGGYRFTGNGSLIIARHTISNARIELSSSGGLWISGTMRLFGSANARVSGYIQPNGRFELRAYLRIIFGGSGVRGRLRLDNHQLTVRGGLYIANVRVKYATFHIGDGTIRYYSSSNIGWAGMDRHYMIYLRRPHGAKFDGRFWAHFRIPIYIWTVTSWGHKKIWLPFKKRRIRYPRRWGWRHIRDIHINYDNHLSAAIRGPQLNFRIGRCSLSYNIRTRRFHVSR
ncbi:MAG: hypothetical protein D6820_08835, partial [Lentisphaerae bacterium]